MSFSADDFSWFGAARRTFGCYLACRRSFGPEQGTSCIKRSLAQGPLGRLFITNYRRQDYAYNLAAAVRALAPEAYDSHLFALEVRLRIYV
jgi:hypothetical protein